MAMDNKPLVAFFEVKDWEIAYLRERLDEAFRLHFSHERLDAQRCEEWRDAWGLSPFIYSRIDGEVLDLAPSVKIVATRSTGFDHVDLEAARLRNIVVSTVPSYGDNTVAEHTFGLILADVLGFRYVALDELLRESDIVSLHVPYNKHTHHMFNGDALAKMKKGAILINTARGGLIDTNALIEALDRGHLLGAGLDVLEGEQLLREEKQVLAHHDLPQETLRTLLENTILIGRPDVVVTPHIGFYSREAQQRILDTTVENLKGCREGRPINVVQ